MTNKSENAYKTIGEVAEILELKSKNKGVFSTHTIRFWETQFKQIRPSIRAGKRRYYTVKDLKIIKYIKFLLKEKGFTISGVKKLLEKKNTSNLDDYLNLGVYKPDLKTNKVIKDKIKNISKIIKDLKRFKNG